MDMKRPKMVLFGFLITLALIVFTFGGRRSSLPATPSSYSSPSSIPMVGGRHVVPGAGAGNETPKSKLLSSAQILEYLHTFSTSELRRSNLSN
ncbi:hypothetical protein ZWY2020_044788 [Hordeum vulgare]|nr:hypothetical protein ZWY2020_044788 [Hordeum vulgare]